MSQHETSRYLPGVLHPEQVARNGRLPRAEVMARLARGYNAVACRQRKLIGCFFQNLRALQDIGEAGNGFAWPFYFRTGEMVEHLTVHLGVAAADNPGDSVPTVEVSVGPGVDPEGAAGDSFRFSFAPLDSGITLGGGEFSHKRIRLVGLTPNREYHGLARYTNGARLIYMTVHEGMKRIADDVEWAVATNPTQFVNEGPIERMAQVDLNFAAVNLWRHSAGHLFSWAPNYSIADEFCPTISSTSFAPIFGASGPRFLLNLLRRGTLSRPDAIPVRMAVRVNHESGERTMQFRMRATASGATAGFTAETTGFDSGADGWPWYVGSTTIPDGFSDWVLEADTDGVAATFSGWSLFQYEP